VSSEPGYGRERYFLGRVVVSSAVMEARRELLMIKTIKSAKKRRKI